MSDYNKLQPLSKILKKRARKIIIKDNFGLNVYDSSWYHKYSEDNLTLVFLHGAGGNLTNWKYQIDYFEKKYRVIAPELMGHGDSDVCNGYISLNDFTCDLELLFDKLGVKNVVLISDSFGTFISLIYLRHHRDVPKVVVAGGAARNFVPFTIRLAKFIPNRIIHFLFNRKFFKNFFYKTWIISKYAGEEKIENFVSEMNAPKVLLAKEAKFFKAIIEFDPFKWKERINMPVLIVNGEFDKICSVREAKSLVKLLPDSKLKIIKKAGHIVMYEKPEEFNHILEKFLKERD